MNNLKKFNTEAEYSAATLNYPAVSWIVSGDTVKYDKEAPAEVNDKLMIAFTTAEGSAGSGKDIVLYNCSTSEIEQSVTSITVNDVAIQDFSNCTLSNYTEGDTVYLIKYGVEGTTIGDWFAGEIGGGNASEAVPLDILFPAQITVIDEWPSNTINIVLEGTTPPEGNANFSSIVEEGIYVPDEAVNTYKASTLWSDVAEKIHPISEYQGNLPV